MLSLAIGILWLAIGVIILGAVILVAFWGVRKAGIVIPPNVEAVVWAIFAILVLIYILTLLNGGGLPHPTIFRSGS